MAAYGACTRFSIFPRSAFPDEREGERFDRAAVVLAKSASVIALICRPIAWGRFWLRALARCRWRQDRSDQAFKKGAQGLPRPAHLDRASRRRAAGAAPHCDQKTSRATEKTRTRRLAKAREKQRVLPDGTLVAASWVIPAAFAK